VLHFVDAETAHGIASTFAHAVAPGSYLVISAGFGRGREGTNFASTYNAQDGPRIYSHSWEEITGLFDLTWLRLVRTCEAIAASVADGWSRRPGETMAQFV
jgi:hypothetical protein